MEGGRQYLRKQSGPAHRANASMQMQMGGRQSMYVEINRCFGELEGSVSYRLDLKLGTYVKWTYKSWG